VLWQSSLAFAIKHLHTLPSFLSFPFITLHQAGDNKGAMIAGALGMLVWLPVRIMQPLWLSFLYTWEAKRLWNERFSIFHWAVGCHTD
jgi:hypothetical protein